MERCVSAVDDAADAARRGDLIVFPTDTIYALACRPDDPTATGRVFEAKRRPEELTLPVLVSSNRAARSLAILDERAERLMATLWPGALTIVAPRRAASGSWALGGEGATIGLRVPGHPLARAVLEAAGPLAATSANRSGQPPVSSCDELHAAFGDLVSIYLCQDAPLEGAASTVIDLSHGEARVLRAGSVDVAQVRDLLGAEGPLLDSPPSKMTRSR